MPILTSRLTTKGQATIPVSVRKALDLKPGERIVFDLQEDRVILRKSQPVDLAFLEGLGSTLSEWSSKEDEQAYADL